MEYFRNETTTPIRLSPSGEAVWSHKTSKVLFVERMYSHVDRVLVIDETGDGRRVVEDVPYSTFDFTDWIPVTVEENNKTSRRHKEIYMALQANEHATAMTHEQIQAEFTRYNDRLKVINEETKDLQTEIRILQVRCERLGHSFEKPGRGIAKKGCIYCGCTGGRRGEYMSQEETY